LISPLADPIFIGEVKNMERERITPLVTIAHDLESKRLRINVELPGVDEKNISLDMKKDHFCVTVPRNGIEYTGCFPLDHEVDTERTETKYEGGILQISTPFKERWDRLREGFAGRPVVKG
jgi:HSP20 family molecular chaperone IbpA